MRAVRIVASAVTVLAVLLSGGLVSAGADTAVVSYLCDLPAGATGSLAGQIPDTITDDFAVTVADSPDPVVQGRTVHLDLDVPFPDIAGQLPDLPIGGYGYFYIRNVDIWQPLPAGINFASVQATLTPAPNWATVTREFGNLKIHIQSAVPGSYIRVNADATPPTIEIEQSPGQWVPFNVIPSVDLDATVNGARGSTIDWHPPTLNAVVKYSKSVPFLINVNWNDANTPCTPVDPNQVIVSTRVASPAMSATLSRTEASVLVGETIHYSVAVQNTGDVALTGVTVAVPAATCDAPPASIAVGATANVACTHTATAADLGTYTRTANVDTAETAAATTNSVSTTVSRPSMSATLSRTEASVLVGQAIHYSVAVQNTGGVALTGVTVAVPAATCDAPPASIAVGATANVACTHTATAADLGTYTRTANVDTAETAATTTNSVSTTVSPRRVADALVATAAAGPFTGDGIYGATVTPTQTLKTTIARGATRTFFVRAGNDGDATDSLTVRGVDTGAAGYRVRYFDDATGVNITTAVNAGTYVVADVAPGATVTLRVKVKATTASALRSSHVADVSVASVADPASVDTVRARVKRT